MTDPSVADAVYLEPLTVPAIEAVIAREKPEGLLAGLGGQTALNLAMALSEAGVLERHNVRLLGTPLEAIRMAEDREAFRDLLDRIDQPYAPSFIVEGATDDARHASAEEALASSACRRSSGPRSRSAGPGGGIVETEDAYWERVRAGLRASPIKQVMIERCLVGWQEIEYEVMRDHEDTCIAVCSMENVDPLGVHTGDSIVVAPVQTLTDQVHQRLRSAALAIIRALGVEGGCNVQFALSPDSTEYAVIEVNPRVSRSSALASKATGYPIARVAAQIAAGRSLAEIPNVVTGTTVAAFEPALDYVVVKLPRFPFDKFPARGPPARVADEGDRRGDGDRPHLRGGAQQGAPRPRAGGRGAAGRGRRLAPDVRLPRRGLRVAGRGGSDPLDPRARTRSSAGSTSAARRARARGSRSAPPRRSSSSGSSSRRTRGCGGCSACSAAACRRRSIRAATGISPWFLAEMGRNIRLEHDVRAAGRDAGGRRRTPTAPRSSRPPSGPRSRDSDLGGLAGVPEAAVREARATLGLAPGYAMVDTCAAEFAAETPYFYSTYASAGSPPEAPPAPRPGALVIGSGPVRIGQGIEFDYCAVQAADVLRRAGWSAVMVNSNPETVSTDFDARTRLYFEPLDAESVRSIIEFESGGPLPGTDPLPAVVAFGGQTPLNLAGPLVASRRAAARLGPRGDRPGGGAGPVRRAPGPARHPAAGGRHGRVDRGGADARGADRLPGHRPAVVRHRRARHRLRVLARGPRPPPRRGRHRGPGPARPHRPLPRGHRGRHRRGVRRHRRAHPGPARARRAGGRPLGRLDRGVPAAARLGRRRRPDRAHDGADLPRARCQGPRQRAVHRPRRRRVPDRGQPAGQPDRAVPVQGDRRADGRARRADRARRDARGSRLGARAAAAARRSSPSRRRRSRPRSSRASTRRSGRSCSRRARSSGSPRTRGSRWPRRSPGRRSSPRGAGDGEAPFALLSIADRDKWGLIPLAKALRRAGYRLAATPGTRAALREAGFGVEPDREAGRGAGRGDRGAADPRARSPTATCGSSSTRPRRAPGAVRDAAEIRHAAIAEGVLCLTAIETGIAAAEALDPAIEAQIAEVRAITDWVPSSAWRASAAEPAARASAALRAR